jgi:hypothetical protein
VSKKLGVKIAIENKGLGGLENNSDMVAKNENVKGCQT